MPKLPLQCHDYHLHGDRKCHLDISPTTPILPCCYKAVVTKSTAGPFPARLHHFYDQLLFGQLYCISTLTLHHHINLVVSILYNSSLSNPHIQIPSQHTPIAATPLTTTLQWSPVCHYNQPILTSISLYPPTRYKTAIETLLQIQIPLSTHNKCHSNLMEHYLWHYYKRCGYSRGFSRSPGQKCRPL